MTLKMHMLEDYVVECGVPVSMVSGSGEQKAESIYSRFNQLERTHTNMANGVECMDRALSV